MLLWGATGTVSWGKEQGLEIGTKPDSCVCSLRRKNDVAHPQPSVPISHFLSCGCSCEQGGRKEGETLEKAMKKRWPGH